MHDHSPEVFDPQWGRAVHEAINESASYRSAAADWRGSLGLEMTPAVDGESRAAFLDLEHGRCRGVRCGAQARVDEATFVLRASAADWRALLEGGLEPLWGIMSGRLKLAKGDLSALLPFAEAARVLVETIATVDAVFPPDPEEVANR